MERSLSYLSEISVSELKGFGEKRINSLKKHGINSVTDLIRIFPRKHYDRSKIMNLSEVPPNIEKEITIFGKITDISVFTTKTRLRITTLTINDETGIARAKWFGPQYIESRFKKDDMLLFGRESAGVPKELHKLLKNKIKIPMNKKTRSLNVAMSVAIVTAEALRQNRLLK